MSNSLTNFGRLQAAVRSIRDGIVRERSRAIQRRRGESEADTWTRSRVRWRNTEPSTALTWGEPLRGDAFVAKVASFGAFGPEKALIEIGPGYGRLLTAITEGRELFDSYTGVDLSAQNVDHLVSKFTDPRIRFFQGDVEEFDLPQRFDSMLSSLTLKHLYPTFEAGLSNVRKHMVPGGRLFFDLIEASLLDRLLSVDAYFREETTFIRRYTRKEVAQILERCGLQLVALDYVEHGENRRRLLVIAEVPG